MPFWASKYVSQALLDAAPFHSLPALVLNDAIEYRSKASRLICTTVSETKNSRTKHDECEVNKLLECIQF